MPLWHKRKVKIVCTLGPSSQNVEQIASLITEGMDIARLNFSHGTHDFHRDLIKNIRQASKQVGRSVAIMQDLQGPKLRAGKLPIEGIMLKKGEIVLLYPEGTDPILPTKDRTILPISAEIAGAVSKDTRIGNRILFDDGKIQTEVIDIAVPEIVVRVIIGGKITSHKGMNLPGTPLTIACLTDKDYEDLKFGLSQGVDAVALSFVRSAQDIKDLREKMRKHIDDPLPLVVSKIEREEAIENQDSIIEVSDALLVARGDMAVEIGAERVPTVQKSLIATCNQLGVPIITATQMLESMISSPTPTRAEASDVANAVYDGTDAVMLSAETASGEYPSESVQTMSHIIMEAEEFKDQFSTPRDLIPTPGSIVESIEFSASRIANHVGAAAIACLTHSGLAARSLAKFRPDTPIVAILDNESMLRRLAFNWGVHGVLIPKIVGTDDLFAMVDKVLTDHGIVQNEDLVVVTAGVPTLKRGTTNMVKVHKIGSLIERAAKRTL